MQAEEQEPDESATLDIGEHDSEEEKRKARAARFNTVYDATKSKGRSARAERSQEQQKGFKTGLDPYDPEEQAKKEMRAARFALNTEETYKPISDEKEDDKRRERAARFGTEFHAVDHSGLQEQDILEDRKNHSADVQRRPDAIHMYGVDRMSTAECLQYFEDYGPSGVEWLDDSSCNVVFADAETAKRAIIGKGRPFSPVDESQGLDLAAIHNLPLLWHKGVDFQKGPDYSRKKRAQKQAHSVPLIFRMATVEDRKGVAPAKPSRHLWSSHVTSRKPGKRTVADLDEDGDVVMGMERRKRRERGGKRIQKKKRKGPNGAEIDMEDVEDMIEEPILITSTVPSAADVASAQGMPDLRGVLSSRREDSQSSQFRLFSAHSAGVPIAVEQPSELSEPAAREMLVSDA